MAVLNLSKELSLVSLLHQVIESILWSLLAQGLGNLFQA
jgi:hypothetical protein